MFGKTQIISELVKDWSISLLVERNLGHYTFLTEVSLTQGKLNICLLNE